MRRSTRATVAAILSAWAMPTLCMGIPSLVGFVLGILELRAIRAGTSSPINQRPARLAVTLGVAGFLVTLAQVVLFSLGLALSAASRR
jgi:hypothetical protein